MALPADYKHEIETLEREVLQNKPTDVLQFCANHFLRRLESQRHEFLLGAQHSTKTMAENNFPGSNPFHHVQQPGMQRLEEEDEMDTFASPTAASFPNNAMNRDASPFAANANPFAQHNDSSMGGFNFGFGGAQNTVASRDQNSSPGGNNQQLDVPQNFPNNYNMGRRVSVSAEVLAPSGTDDSDWKPPTYPKTQEQLSRLRAAVSRNFLFSHLDDDQTEQVLGALQERKIPSKDIKVIAQGDVGDYFYVVETGSFDIYVSPTGKIEPGANGMGNKVASCGPGTSFGELALMYNAPRAATVNSTEPSVIWQLDRITFRRILMDSAFQRRRMYESFLDSVPLLNTLTPYERSKIADALETQKMPAGSTIIREGDVGDHFYMLESGTAAVYKSGVEQSLKTYNKGDYFGELALLDDKPRAASVVAETEIKVAMLGKNGFQRLLGPVESIMRRDDPSKRAGSAQPQSSSSAGLFDSVNPFSSS
ncbi:camp-dependent protein kinase regulatory subunit [Aureobasidium melanogenum CBS 110374]|uniref:cAMP-dependent protein kinase regulatory subunit n=1 Tax=Aureobasidium melanogenum (strain CBS 110374) TaxID=1043003 RepID=A0A074VST9_AURM1|nr:camp-dependent protein kinase regulatory subunit [Aureobasidium melanogenum CBS 110374]KEQ62309.1 camp-dependent protein kinase regulatory subunit [Aureobasidium melanogenum CBS 110374]